MFNTFDDSQTAQLRSEILALIEVDCDTICRIQGAWHKDNAIGLIIEYMDLGSLDFFLSDTYKAVELPERVLAAMAYQILWGLCYLHYGKTMHRDIKPANILLSSEGDVKLSDFGISSVLLDASSTLAATSVGTFRFMSPERLLGERYGPTADVWSLGLTLMQLVLRAYPFEYCGASSIDLITELEVVEFAEFLPSFRTARRSGRSSSSNSSSSRSGSGSSRTSSNSSSRHSASKEELGNHHDRDEAAFSPLLVDFLASMLTVDPCARASSESLLHESLWLQAMLGEGDGGLVRARTVVRDWVGTTGMSLAADSLGVSVRGRDGARIARIVEDEKFQEGDDDEDDAYYERQFLEADLASVGKNRRK